MGTLVFLHSLCACVRLRLCLCVCVLNSCVFKGSRADDSKEPRVGCHPQHPVTSFVRKDGAISLSCLGSQEDLSQFRKMASPPIPVAAVKRRGMESLRDVLNVMKVGLLKQRINPQPGGKNEDCWGNKQEAINWWGRHT